MTRLSARELNRALLSRQHLLRRCDVPELDVVSGLVGLHAQIPVGPYVALWSRLHNYDPSRLSTMVSSRALVRTALMRSTIHLVTPDDCMTLRPLVQPVLDRDLHTNSAHGRVVRDLDLDAVVRHGLELLDAQPRTPSELGKAMHERWPAAKPESGLRRAQPGGAGADPAARNVGRCRPDRARFGADVAWPVG
jgi:hypothetical protein